MVEIASKLTPILAEMFTLGPGNNHHPAIGQLFNWLIEPQRTGEEFNYAIGELADDVSGVMQEHFTDYLYDEIDLPYLCSTAAEALAVRCHILKG